MNEDITEGYRLTKIPHKHQLLGKYDTNEVNENEKNVNSNNRLKTYDLNSKLLHKKKSFSLDSSNESCQINELQLNKKRSSITTCISNNDTDNNDTSNSTSNTNSDEKLSSINNNYYDLNTKNANEETLKSVNNNNNHNKAQQTSSSVNNNDANSKFQIQHPIPSYKSDKPVHKILNNSKSNHISVSKSLSSPLSALFSTSNPNKNKSNQSNDLGTSWSPSLYHNSLRKSLNNTSGLEANTNATEINHNNNINNVKNILSGYLNKYNEKTKKWKPYWFTLNQTDQQLFYFSNEKVSLVVFLLTAFLNLILLKIL